MYFGTFKWKCVLNSTFSLLKDKLTVAICCVYVLALEPQLNYSRYLE